MQLLKARFPNGDLDYQPSTGNVFISVPLSDGDRLRAGLTWQQAKYLTMSELAGDDLKAGRFPADWPK
jgi:hypothetical protein